MNTYRVKFETIMVATSPTMAAEKVHEGLEAGNYQRSIFNVTDVNTDEESEEIVSVEVTHEDYN